MPVLTARGAGVRHRRRRLFHDLDVTAEPGDLVAVVGPPGSGRTTLLLALAGRFRLSAGTVTLDGAAELGYVPEVTAPEPVFTVAEHVRERLALLGREKGARLPLPSRMRSARFALPAHEKGARLPLLSRMRSARFALPAHEKGEPVDLLGLDPEIKGRDLTPYEKQVLGLVLAQLSHPALIALDGLDHGLDAAEQVALLKQLAEIAAGGTTVVFTARDVDPESVTTVIRLSGRESEGER